MENFSGLEVTVRPIEEAGYPAQETRNRRPSRFRASWASTRGQLAQELRALDARKVEIRLDIPASQIRQDGLPYAVAQVRSPRVVVSFDTPERTRLVFPCDTWSDWRDNLRAIALSMEALRAVDRYGVTKGREQFQGFKALPNEGGSTATMTAEAAAEVIAGLAGSPVSAPALVRDRSLLGGLYRAAARAAHPDAPGGSHDAFTRLQTAKAVLERHFGVVTL